jgi:serine/threonine protein phosphatase PrpC
MPSLSRFKRRSGGKTDPQKPPEQAKTAETVDPQVESVQAEQASQTAPQPGIAQGPFAALSPLHRLLVEHEHHQPGLGEDARPIWALRTRANGLIGVFDGLGGAGGEVIRIGEEERTGAWLASRRVRNVVLTVYAGLIRHLESQHPLGDSDIYGQMSEPNELQQPFDFTAELRRAIEQELSEYAIQLNAGGGGRLKSKLIKTLPTTLAVCWYDLSRDEFTAVWAGDSRVYYLNPTIGLQQVTTDDLKSGADALENLIEDSPMSNCVSAGTDFVLHERRVGLQPFSILIAASDGCFGYVQTPLHFEYMLLSTMTEAGDWQDWQDRLQAEIMRVTSDDSTLSAVAIGWPDFASCQKHFAGRFAWCAQRIQAYNEGRNKVERLERDLNQARADLAASTRELWAEYRKTYESLAQVRTRDVPDRGGADPVTGPWPVEPGDVPAAELEADRAQQANGPAEGGHADSGEP